MTEDPFYEGGYDDAEQSDMPPPDDTPDAAAESRRAVEYRGASNDPIFGYLIAIAVGFGSVPLLPDAADLRYTLTWGLLAGFGVLAWLFGRTDRVGEEPPVNIAWGVVFGALVGVPVYLFGGGVLQRTVELMFSGMTGGAVLAYLIFVMPLGETLFFRGIMWERFDPWTVAGQSSCWSLVLFFPPLNVFRFPAVAIFIGTAMVIVNVVYSYVRRRNGIAAAWICQIVVNLIVIYIPFVGG